MRHRSRRPVRLPVILTAVVAVLAALGAFLLADGTGHPRPTAAMSGVAGVPVAAASTPGTAPSAAPSSGPSASAGASGSPTARRTASAPAASAADSASGAVPVPGPGQRVVTFVNRTSQTVWAAAQASAKHPLAQTGWVLPPGASASVLVPGDWSGRMWGRTGCRFDAGGQGHCVTGDCNGLFQCGYGGSRDPETLAEFTLGAWGGMDFYDVNLDGFNLPMYINETGGAGPDRVSATGCVPAGCTHDLLASCPAELQQKANGQTVGCLLPCQVFNTDDYCCRGKYSGRANCVPARIWPVDYAAIYKAAEPTGYSYVFDDQTSTMACKGRCDYRITFGVSP